MLGQVELTTGWVLLGLCVGSFLGVLVDRLPAGRPVLWGRSACDACGARLGVLELVPVLGFLVLRGRCRRCGAPIPRRLLGVELAAAYVPLAAILAGETGIGIAEIAVLGWTLLALGMIDARHMILPDALTLPLIVAGLADAALLAPDTMTGRALGAALGYTAFRALALAYRAWRGRDGLGEGDAKLLAAAGAWLGWQALPQVVLAASLSGLAFALLARLAGRKLTATTRLAFGTFLCLGTWAVALPDAAGIAVAVAAVLAFMWSGPPSDGAQGAGDAGNP